ncbi:MAG: Wadjet anti-phage system protein JetA family protein, partial [Bdellovibrio bacteriovorus]
MTQLFDRLPDRLFSPLASANRRIYGALLLDLYPLFFDQIHADVFPSRDTVRQEIEERLAVMAAAWQEEPDAASIPVSPAEPEATPAAQAYRRLLAAGWIEEEMEGYRVRVT